MSTSIHSGFFLNKEDLRTAYFWNGSNIWIHEILIKQKMSFFYTILPSYLSFEKKE